MLFAGAGQVETTASAYWRQRVQAVAPVAGRMARQAFTEQHHEPVHGPAVYVTLSPAAQARLDGLCRDLAG